MSVAEHAVVLPKIDFLKKFSDVAKYEIAVNIAPVIITSQILLELLAICGE